VTHWPEIVGAEIADHCEPMRMIWPRRVHEDDPEPRDPRFARRGPVALEIQHLSGVILEKVKPLLRLARGRAHPDPAGPAGATGEEEAAPCPGPGGGRALAAEMADVADDGLRDALARLGAAVKRT
jgi:hypothetical protein